MNDFIHHIIKKERLENLKDSPQLTLGNFISCLSKIKETEVDQESISVQFDFGSAIPTTLGSWRGSYDELALGYELTGYSGEGDYGSMTVDKLLEELEGAIGKTFTGWKGGDFVMSKDTPIWVSNTGDASETGIVGVLNLGYKIVILTSYCEY